MYCRKNIGDSIFGLEDIFAVIVGNVNTEDVQRYIEDQEEHHKKDDFRISEF